MIGRTLSHAARKIGNSFFSLADYFESAAENAALKRAGKETEPGGKKQLSVNNAKPAGKQKSEEIVPVSAASKETLNSPKPKIESFRISADPRLAEEKKHIETVEKLELEKKKKKRRIAIIVVPFAIIIILVASTIPSYIKSMKEYTKATELLENEEYDLARDMYTDLGNYSDSQEKVIFDIPYRKALKLLKYAQDNDEEGLALAEIKKSDIPENESSQVVMYRKVVEMLESLNGYKDSDKKIAVANAGIDEYFDKLNLKAYNEAKSKLEENRYLQARDEFISLGDYRDSSELALECIYRRAKGLLEYSMNNNIREISINLSRNAEIQTKISIPRSVLVSQSGDAVALIELKDTCGVRSADIIYEDIPGEGFIPICDAIAAEFEFLADYKDSMDLEKKAKETGDFTKEFFNLCSSGYLSSAQEWLDKYDDEFEERSTYSMMINTFLPYCRYWQLHAGDSSLIPFVAGDLDSVCDSFLSAVSIEAEKITLIIAPFDNDYTIELEYLPEANGFRLAKDETETSVFALINNLGIFTISRYSNMGFAISSCEYTPE